MSEIDLLKSYYLTHKEVFGIEKIGIFGSVARGEASEISDVDIVVQLSVPKMFNMIAIKQDLEELYHRNIDIVRLRENMNLYLKNRIDAEAIYV